MTALGAALERAATANRPACSWPAMRGSASRASSPRPSSGRRPRATRCSPAAVSIRRPRCRTCRSPRSSGSSWRAGPSSSPRIPELSAAPAGAACPARPAANREMGQLRVFDAMLSALDSLTAESPALLVLEDLHWADRSSRDLLVFLLSRLTAQRLVVLATYRTDDLHRRHPLRPVLSELVRLPAVERLDLGPLDAAESLTSSGASPTAPFPSSCCAGSRSAAKATRSSPRSWSRPRPKGCRTGSPRCSWPASRACRPPPSRCCGWPRSPGAGSSTASSPPWRSMPDDELEQALRDAVTHHVLVVRHRCGDAYVFRHALLREAIYTELLPGERSRLHARYATLIADRRRGGGQRPPSSPIMRCPRTICRSRWRPPCGRRARPIGAPPPQRCCCTPSAPWSCGRPCPIPSGWPTPTRSELTTLGGVDGQRHRRSRSGHRAGAPLARPRRAAAMTRRSRPCLAAATPCGCWSSPGATRRPSRSSSCRALELLADQPTTAESAWAHAVHARVMCRLDLWAEARASADTAHELATDGLDHDDPHVLGALGRRPDHARRLRRAGGRPAAGAAALGRGAAAGPAGPPTSASSCARSSTSACRCSTRAGSPRPARVRGGRAARRRDRHHVERLRAGPAGVARRHPVHARRLGRRRGPPPRSRASRCRPRSRAGSPRRAAHRGGPGQAGVRGPNAPPSCVTPIPPTSRSSCCSGRRAPRRRSGAATGRRPRGGSRMRSPGSMSSSPTSSAASCSRRSGIAAHAELARGDPPGPRAGLAARAGARRPRARRPPRTARRGRAARPGGPGLAAAGAGRAHPAHRPGSGRLERGGRRVRLRGGRRAPGRLPPGLRPPAPRGGACWPAEWRTAEVRSTRSAGGQGRGRMPGRRAARRRRGGDGRARGRAAR